MIRAYAEEHGLGQLFGEDGAVKIVERIETAPDPEAVRRALEPLGLYDSVISVDPRKLQELFERRVLPPDAEESLLSGRDEVRKVKALHLRDADRAGRR